MSMLFDFDAVVFYDKERNEVLWTSADDWSIDNDNNPNYIVTDKVHLMAEDDVADYLWAAKAKYVHHNEGDIKNGMIYQNGKWVKDANLEKWLS